MSEWLYSHSSCPVYLPHTDKKFARSFTEYFTHAQTLCTGPLLGGRGLGTRLYKYANKERCPVVLPLVKMMILLGLWLSCRVLPLQKWELAYGFQTGKSGAEHFLFGRLFCERMKWRLGVRFSVQYNRSGNFRVLLFYVKIRIATHERKLILCSQV